jgi:hypothetical protein
MEENDDDDDYYEIYGMNTWARLKWLKVAASGEVNSV